MADAHETFYNYWSIAHFVLISFAIIAILAVLAIVPLIMLQSFFGGNKFNVKGKVRFYSFYEECYTNSK